jgi:inosose dehydratase
MSLDKVKIGIAPIAWTNDDMPDLGSENTFEQCVSEMALAGFAGCEVGSKFPRHDPERLKHMLDIRGLVICNAWFSTFFADGKRDDTIKLFTEHMNFLKFMGAKVIGCSEQSGAVQGTSRPIFEAKKVFTDGEWNLVSKGYDEIAKIAEGAGMKVCLHHHMGTGVQTTAEIDRFMESVAENVFLLYDTGHIFYSDGSQEAMLNILEKYSKRVAHVHLKDVRPDRVVEVKEKKLSFLDGVRLGTFTVPGDGSIDFNPVFKLLESSGYEGWLVVEAEQDPAKANPFEYAKMAHDNITKFL